MDDHNQPPLNPLPPAVWFLVTPMIALELLFNLGANRLMGGPNAIGWRARAIEDFGIWPAYWRQQSAAGAFDLELLGRFFTYPFLHINPTHAIFAIVILLALGKYVGEVFHSAKTLAVFFISGAAGALAYVSLPWIEPPLYGAYPGDYGLIGAFTYIMWAEARLRGGNRYRAFGLIGMLLAIQIFFGLLEGQFANVAADLSGFVTGFALSFLLRPGGWARLLAKLRQR